MLNLIGSKKRAKPTRTLAFISTFFLEFHECVDVCECACKREQKTGKRELGEQERTVKQNISSDAAFWTTFLLVIRTVKIQAPL